MTESVDKDEYQGGHFLFGKEIFDVLMRLKFGHDDKGRVTADKFILPEGYSVVKTEIISE
jgi:hypothetical protein